MPSTKKWKPVDMDAVVADCVAANEGADAQAAVAAVLERAVSDPQAMLAGLGEPTEAGMRVFHHSLTLTIFAATWTPRMNLRPHNHLMWAVIGIYTGREDNIFWHRSDRGVAAHGARCLFAGDVVMLPDSVIHSVTNPLERFTGGLHIYGGDFFATTRSQWDPETLVEQPSDGDTIRREFARENEKLRHR